MTTLYHELEVFTNCEMAHKGIMKEKKKFWKFNELDDQVTNRWELFKKLYVLWIFSNISQGNSKFLVE